MTEEVLVGTSGWSYPHWRGPFYPPEVRPDGFLAYYAGRFDTVEVNSSFYRLPAETTVRRWRDLAPPGFTYAVKATRFITHYRRLKDAQEPLAQFLERVSVLDVALGPLLFQLPPSFPLRLERLEAFLALLPARPPVAFEFRQATWFVPGVYDALARRGAAFCISDLHGRATPEIVTAPLVYVRLHGPGRYSGSYDDASLAAWAEKCAAWARDGRQVRVYFDNDQRGYAARDAGRLRELLGQTPSGPRR